MYTLPSHQFARFGSDHRIESEKYGKLSRKIHSIRIDVANGREGIFQLKYARGMQRRNPIQEKTVKGISGMVCRGW
jgi:hypothetical protein